MNVQQNQNGQPLAGALLYIYVVNTVAVPQLAYQDVNLTQALPWPIAADQNGRLPMFYLTSGSVHVRLTDASGQVQFDYPNVLVIGGASGGGGGGGQVVDPTAIAATGDVKFRLTSESLSGWVILNGQTIGSPTSGASGLASATTQNLFIYLWTNCPNAHCPVTPGGRGLTALADFQANKQLQLMDMRDSMLVGRDCMGNSCRNGILLSNIASGGGDTADTPGAFGGVANQPITLTNLPNLSLPVSVSVTIGSGQGAHVHGGAGGGFWVNVSGQAQGMTSPGNANGGLIGATAAATLPAMNGSGTGSASLSGSGAALAIMNPFKLGTLYQKL